MYVFKEKYKMYKKIVCNKNVKNNEEITGIED